MHEPLGPLMFVVVFLLIFVGYPVVFALGGTALIFGLLGIVNFAHGAQYMLGAFVALLVQQWLGLNYWFALILAPLVVGAEGRAW